MAEEWVAIGKAQELAKRELRQVVAGKTPIAVVFREGRFSALSGTCNHVGGPLGEGTIDGLCDVFGAAPRGELG
jgi:nitrite reductase/ring-hydroxylating ferredoxin subunit